MSICFVKGLLYYLYMRYKPLSARDRAVIMFDDLFDFGKKRTLKQSIGFFIFHGTLALGVMAGLSAFGIS